MFAGFEIKPDMSRIVSGTFQDVLRCSLISDPMNQFKKRTKKERLKHMFSNFVFPVVSRLDAKIAYFWAEIRIPRPKLYTQTAGKV